MYKAAINQAVQAALESPKQKAGERQPDIRNPRGNNGNNEGNNEGNMVNWKSKDFPLWTWMNPVF